MDTEARLAALYARTSNGALIDALLIIDATPQDELTPELRMSRAWTIGELERRYPKASAAVEAAFEEAEQQTIAGNDVPDVDYVAVLVAAIRNGE